MFEFKQYNLKKYNISLLILVIIASICGIFFIKFVDDSDPTLSLVKKQIFGLVLGLTMAIFVSLIDYHFIGRFMWVLYIVNMILLLLVRTPLGVSVNEARRWLKIFGVQIQPTEFSKIIMIIFMANLLSMLNEKINKFSTILIASILMALPTLLILVQTDLSSSMVMVFLFVMLVFVAGISYKIIIPLLAISIPTIPGVFWYIQQPYQVLIGKYQQNRILGFLKPELYSDTIMYQQNNSVEAIGSGSLYGKILSDGVDAVKSSSYVAEAQTDFIFAVIGEEVGFIGGCVIIILMSLIVFKCLMVAKKAKDLTGMLIATGVACMIMFQVFVNIGVATALLPNTGLPMPFISYGLSSLLSSMIGIGLVINIDLQRNKSRN